MIQKRDFMSNLKNVKVVLGNGFDLFCNLKTSYRDYFDSIKEDVDQFIKWQNQKESIINYLIPELYYDKCPFQLIQFPENLTLWEVIFIRTSYSNNNYNWCDIEQLMKNLLINKNILDCLEETAKISVSPNDLEFKKFLKEKSDDSFAYTIIILLYLIKIMKKGNLPVEKYEYRDILLDDLNRFEKKFGEFIYRQFNNDLYRINSKIILSKLCDMNEIKSIDTFNYSVIDTFKDVLFNINGTYRNPIFGIDSTGIETSNLVYKFTKTNRRQINQIYSNDIPINIKCDNLIIFGHSLNEQDYNYFFPILSSMGVGTNDFNGSIIFAYSIYDENKADYIRNTLVKSVAKLFEEYQSDKLKNNQNRLLEQMDVEHKIIYYEIENSDLIVGNK